MAHAATSGFAVGGGAADSGSAGDDFYEYTTRDLALDLVSPLVAYKVVSSLIFKQELPVWLDGIIYVTAIAAAVVVATNSTALDTYLQ